MNRLEAVRLRDVNLEIEVLRTLRASKQRRSREAGDVKGKRDYKSETWYLLLLIWNFGLHIASFMHALKSIRRKLAKTIHDLRTAESPNRGTECRVLI